MNNNDLVNLQKNNRKLIAVWGTSLIGAFLAGYALNGESTGFSIMVSILAIIGFVTVTRWWWKVVKALLRENKTNEKQVLQ